jgi:hypothetical protein
MMEAIRKFLSDEERARRVLTNWFGGLGLAAVAVGFFALYMMGHS